jgi:hypothetical protein
VRFHRQSIEHRKIAIDEAVAGMCAAQMGCDTSPEWAAVLLATEECVNAGAARSALGGYVPVGHPGHPSKWSTARQDALADAEAGLRRANEALRIARLVHANRTIA